MAENDLSRTFDSVIATALQRGVINEETQRNLFNAVADIYRTNGWGRCTEERQIDSRLTNRAPWIRCETNIDGIEVLSSPEDNGRRANVVLRRTLEDGTRQWMRTNWNLDPARPTGYGLYISSGIEGRYTRSRSFSVDFLGRAWEWQPDSSLRR